MASASNYPATVSPQTRERIQSPLHKLRGAIRRYIVLEAIVLFVTFLTLWFWLGMGFDYLAFKTTGIDFVQSLPRWLRLVVLAIIVLVLAGLLLWRLVRLFRDFRPEALALVLERRFPKLLGDRLITAVELAGDLDQAEQYGYSRAMILETVREVSGRVDQIAVHDVFNWRRLRWRWLVFAGLAIGFPLCAFAGDVIAYRAVQPVNFGYRLADVSQIWFERNILLKDTLWPRRAYLEIVDFPESGEMRIGRDAPSPGGFSS